MDISYRFLKEMEDVVYDVEWFKRQKRNYILYEMRRGVKENGLLRYDITILNGKLLGKEYNKTLGHYHPKGYPEIYEVLRGKAIYLLQKPVRIISKKILDVVAIYAKKGDQVIIPPGYGHITINPTRNKLMMANIVCSCFHSIYEPIKKYRGGAYYYTIDGWKRNINYETPRLRRLKGKKIFDEKLEYLIEDEKKIEWLLKPKKFPDKYKLR